MILAAGLTPAWQQIMVFERFQAGEVNRAAQVQWCASGKVLNVGLALHHLGAECRTLTPLGGPAGDFIQREFASLGVDVRSVPTATPTRVCTTILDRQCGASLREAPHAAERRATLTTELVENAGPLSSDDLARFTAAYMEEACRAEIVVLTGSLPSQTPTSFYRDLVRDTPGRVILDGRGQELISALECRPFLVKPNREELALTVGRDLSRDEELWVAMREIHERGAEWAVVSSGRDAVWMLGSEGLYRAIPPIVSVVNPIGCGDCLAAGIAWSLAEGNSPVQALSFGMAAAAENVQQLLPARLDPLAVRRLAMSIEVARVDRHFRQIF